MVTSKTPITATPIPRRPIYILCAILFCEAFVSSMIFPFVNFMVKDFNIAKSEEQVGYYSGYLASSFFLGQFVSSYFWGYLSDKYGRRPILLVGVFGSMVSTTLFGFSPSYAFAIVIRSVGGLLNSNFAIARSYIGDITDATNRVRGFSFVGLMWGAGAIFGPVTGGLLANPNSVLRQYPYMLPSLVSGFLSLVSWLIALLLLKESNKQVLIRKGLHPPDQLELSDLGASKDSDETVDEDDDVDADVDADVDDSDGGFVLKADEIKALGISDPTSPSKLAPLIGERAREEEISSHHHHQADRVNDDGLWGTIRSAVERVTRGDRSKKYSHIVEDEDESLSSSSVSVSVSVPEKEKEKEREGTKHAAWSVVLTIFKDRSVMVAITLLSLAGLCVITIDELFPLWAMNPPPVGLAFKSAKIGMSWIIGGVTLVIFQGLVYPRLAQKVGLLTMIRFGSVGFAFVYISFPMLTMLVGKGFLLWLGLGATLFGRYVTGASVGTTLNILVNSVGGEFVCKHRGAVNGIAMSVSGLARAIAPVFGSSLFAWSNTNGLSFPFNHYFTFEVMAIVLLFMFLLSFLISKDAVNK